LGHFFWTFLRQYRPTTYITNVYLKEPPIQSDSIALLCVYQMASQKTADLLDGTACSARIRAELKGKTEDLKKENNIVPCIAVVRVQ